MISTILFILFFSLLSACVSKLLDFALGLPGAHYDPFITDSEINTHSIFFLWSFYLALSRLQENKILTKVQNGLREELESEDPIIRNLAKHQFRLKVFVTGRDFFTWEYAVGMCIFCTNFWISVGIIILLFLFPIMPLTYQSFLISIPFFSHVILRKI